MNNISNLYIGTVIRNSDIIEKGKDTPNGQVRVLINGISTTSASGDKFKFPIGGNLQDTITSETEKLVDELEVDAYVLHPVVGGGGSLAKYNANRNEAFTSDSDFPTGPENEPPANNYGDIIEDGFVGDSIGTAGVNPNGFSYTPDNRSNCPKGMFSMPNVGDRVLIAFINGARGLPVVLGVLYGFDHIESIFGVGLENVYPNYPYGNNLISS